MSRSYYLMVIVALLASLVSVSAKLSLDSYSHALTETAQVLHAPRTFQSLAKMGFKYCSEVGRTCHCPVASQLAFGSARNMQIVQSATTQASHTCGRKDHGVRKAKLRLNKEAKAVVAQLTKKQDKLKREVQKLQAKLHKAKLAKRNEAYHARNLEKKLLKVERAKFPPMESESRRIRRRLVNKRKDKNLAKKLGVSVKEVTKIRRQEERRALKKRRLSTHKEEKNLEKLMKQLKKAVKKQKIQQQAVQLAKKLGLNSKKLEKLMGKKFPVPDADTIARAIADFKSKDKKWEIKITRDEPKPKRNPWKTTKTDISLIDLEGSSIFLEEASTTERNIPSGEFCMCKSASTIVSHLRKLDAKNKKMTKKIQRANARKVAAIKKLNKVKNAAAVAKARANAHKIQLVLAQEKAREIKKVAKKVAHKMNKLRRKQEKAEAQRALVLRKVKEAERKRADARADEQKSLRKKNHAKAVLAKLLKKRHDAKVLYRRHNKRIDKLQLRRASIHVLEKARIERTKVKEVAKKLSIQVHEQKRVYKAHYLAYKSNQRKRRNQDRKVAFANVAKKSIARKVATMKATEVKLHKLLKKLDKKNKVSQKAVMKQLKKIQKIKQQQKKLKAVIQHAKKQYKQALKAQVGDVANQKIFNAGKECCLQHYCNQVMNKNKNGGKWLSLSSPKFSFKYCASGIPSKVQAETATFCDSSKKIKSIMRMMHSAEKRQLYPNRKCRASQIPSKYIMLMTKKAQEARQKVKSNAGKARRLQSKIRKNKVHRQAMTDRKKHIAKELKKLETKKLIMLGKVRAHKKITRTLKTQLKLQKIKAVIRKNNLKRAHKKHVLAKKRLQQAKNEAREMKQMKSSKYTVKAALKIAKKMKAKAIKRAAMTKHAVAKLAASKLKAKKIQATVKAELKKVAKVKAAYTVIKAEMKRLKNEKEKLTRSIKKADVKRQVLHHKLKKAVAKMSLAVVKSADAALNAANQEVAHATLETDDCSGNHNWTCYKAEKEWVVARINKTICEVECLALDGSNCKFTPTEMDCKEALQTAALGSEPLHPLACGVHHKSKFGNTGYDTHGHWCKSVRAENDRMVHIGTQMSSEGGMCSHRQTFTCFDGKIPVKYNQDTCEVECMTEDGHRCLETSSHAQCQQKADNQNLDGAEGGQVMSCGGEHEKLNELWCISMLRKFEHDTVVQLKTSRHTMRKAAGRVEVAQISEKVAEIDLRNAQVSERKIQIRGENAEAKIIRIQSKLDAQKALLVALKEKLQKRKDVAFQLFSANDVKLAYKAEEANKKVEKSENLLLKMYSNNHALEERLVKTKHRVRTAIRQEVEGKKLVGGKRARVVVTKQQYKAALAVSALTAKKYGELTRKIVKQTNKWVAMKRRQYANAVKRSRDAIKKQPKSKADKKRMLYYY